MCQWIIDGLFHPRFNAEDVRTVASNLLRRLHEEKRDGYSACWAMHVGAHEMPPSSHLNDHAIAVSVQEPFLKSLVADIKDGKFDAICSDLMSLIKSLVRHPRALRDIYAIIVLIVLTFNFLLGV
eukprot:GFYU01027718.1.p1 GENE.GFYU01027718.1~~GFYU01027718.1.p1  ORF type:complete len:125 (+),score=21.69 GFYU01027718.1:258-632(+)